MDLKVGDKIKTEAGGPYLVYQIDDNGLIWYKIKYGVGQTCLSNVTEIIKA